MLRESSSSSRGVEGEISSGDVCVAAVEFGSQPCLLVEAPLTTVPHNSPASPEPAEGEVVREVVVQVEAEQCTPDQSTAVPTTARPVHGDSAAMCSALPRPPLLESSATQLGSTKTVRPEMEQPVFSSSSAASSCDGDDAPRDCGPLANLKSFAAVSSSLKAAVRRERRRSPQAILRRVLAGSRPRTGGATPDLVTRTLR